MRTTEVAAWDEPHAGEDAIQGCGAAGITVTWATVQPTGGAALIELRSHASLALSDRAFDRARAAPAVGQHRSVA